MVLSKTSPLTFFVFFQWNTMTSSLVIIYNFYPIKQLRMVLIFLTLLLLLAGLGLIKPTSIHKYYHYELHMIKTTNVFLGAIIKAI